MNSSLQVQLNRILMGSPLRRRGFALGTIISLLLLLAFAGMIFSLTFSSIRPDTASVFWRSMCATSVLTLVPLAILWWLDRRERESLWLLAAAFLWGGVIATSLALPLNSAILAGIAQWVAKNPAVELTLGADAALMIGAPIAGPLVEEITKGLGLILLFFLLRAEYDNMRDGFIYGAVVGTGFNWFEAPLYVAQGYAEYGDAPWELQLGARFALFGMGGHALYSGLFGAFLGLARQTRRWFVRYSAPLVGLLLAISAHALNNLLPMAVTLAKVAAGELPPTESTGPLPDVGLLEAWASVSLMNLIVFLPFVVLVLFLLWRSGRWERKVILEELANERADTVTAEEYEDIQRDGVFRTRRIATVDRRQSAALVNAQHELAFRKRRVCDRGGNPEADPVVKSWREEVRRLRGMA
ncbi:MAG: PrsW family intramembrane metalloprotease [Gammaproteobacteria bacterium]